ncbi:hypothetical protein [Kallotenue papyrolyticum]|uniref:hypothetical protein n=1 Tax=Kallotenue papyrolyticum TaxID=1325125 RepID=UPI00047853E4|nr:hypothetical protein [Kallotenue papyrolyticum]
MSEATKRPEPDAALPPDADAPQSDHIPGVFGEVPVAHRPDRDGITGPAEDATLGSAATGVHNLAGGSRTPPGAAARAALAAGASRPRRR